MQRTSSLDIIELKKHKKENLMQSQLKKKKKKRAQNVGAQVTSHW